MRVRYPRELRDSIETMKQILVPGDWSETVDVQPGGWAFEYANDFYPDNDDTAMALMALQAQFEERKASSDALPPDLRAA